MSGMQATLEERAQIHLRHDDIVDLVREIDEKVDEDMHKIRTDAECIERQCNGDQHIGVNPDRYAVQEAWWADVPKMSQNLMGNIALTWTSLLLKDRPSAYCVPAGSSLEEQWAAKIGTNIIEYEQQRLDYSNRLHRAVLYGAHHGTAGLKVWFDPIENRVDIKPVTVFDFVIDNREDYTEADWIVFTDFIDFWEAKALYESAGILVDPQLEEWHNAAQEKKHDVKKREVWYRPSFRFPGGLYACVVGDQVVESMPYPYVFKGPDGKPQSVLPIALFKARNQRGTAYGYSWLRDVSKLQNGINEIASRQFKAMRQTTQMRLLLPKGLTDQIGDENGVVVFDQKSEEAVKAVRWVEPAMPSQQLNDQLDRLSARIYEVAGLTQSTVGGDSYASQSGRAKAFQAELDVQKSADAVKSLESCILRFWTLVLKLIQHYYDVERTIAIAQEDGEPPLSIRFSGVDLEGQMVRLESRSANDATASVKQQNAQQALQAGLIDQQGYAEATNSVAHSLGRAVADDLIDQLLAGQTLDITPETVQPAAFMAAVDDRVMRAKLEKNMGLVQQLLQLKTTYQQMIAQPPQSVDAEPQSPAPPDSVAPPLPQAGSVFAQQPPKKGP